MLARISIIALLLLGTTTDVSPNDPKTSSLHKISGLVTNIKEFPSVVVILNDGFANCGGVIINSKWILTAGLCFMGAEEENFSNTRILAGTTYLSTGGSWHYVEKAYRSNKLISRSGGGVGVMKVTPPFYLRGDYMKPAILPSQGLIPQPGEMATIAAHGGLFETGIQQSDELRKADFQVMKNDECSKFYNGQNFNITHRFFCTQELDKERLCLWGNSDVTFKDDVAIGFRIWDQDCSGMPNIHIRLSRYIDWILKKTRLPKQKKNKSSSP